MRALAQAEMAELEEVDLTDVFYDSGEGSAELLTAVARSRRLRKLDMWGCRKLEAAGLRSSFWSSLLTVFY